jgi:hypothetical protein
MKKCLMVFFLVVFFASYSCVSNKKVSYKNENVPFMQLHEKYKVLRIDSIKNVYIVYAKKDSILYKIVSLKDSVQCTHVQVGKEYPFMLMSRVPKDFKGMDISPNTIPHISGIDYYGTWIGFERDSINDIFISINLKGLCVQ